MTRSAAELANHLAARPRHHPRRLLVLAGQAQWARNLLAGAAELPESRLYVGANGLVGWAATTYRHVRSYLGQELTLLAYDAHDGFDPDAFAAALGTVRGGGAVVLLVPRLEQWPDQPDPAAVRILPAGFTEADLGTGFRRRLARFLSLHPAVTLWRQGQGPPTPPTDDRRAAQPQESGDPSCRTADQAAAVAELEALGRDVRGTVLLTADRGRGKSAALGIAAARLLNAGLGQLALTAPRKAAVGALLEHAHAEWQRLNADAAFPDARLDYTAPAELLGADSAAGVAFVDEAAAIPAPLLRRLAQHFPVLAFASTVHGYEGTGRGLTLRFQAELDRLRPGWRLCQLRLPIRWPAEDPVERFAMEALLLDAEPTGDPGQPSPASVKAERLDRTALANAESSLRQLFGLLIQAHYRTTPLDLRNLLEGPGIEVFAQRAGGRLIGAALVSWEGPLDEAMAGAVWAGQRRPHGHLLPQSLTYHAGIPEAGRCRYARLMRIAIHPDVRRRGLGRSLVDAVRESVAAAGADVLGTSFAATPGLIDFWQHCGLRAVRVGNRPDTTSGRHTVMMAEGLSKAGVHLTTRAHQRALADTAALRDGPLASMDPDVIRRLGEPPAMADRPVPEDWLIGLGFAERARGWAESIAALHRILAQLPAGTAHDDALLEACIREMREPATVAQRFGESGRKAVERRLREVLAERLTDCNGPELEAARNRLAALAPSAS